MLWLFCTFNYAYLYPNVQILLVNPFKQSKGLQTTLVIKYIIYNQLNLQELWIKVFFVADILKGKSSFMDVFGKLLQ